MLCDRSTWLDTFLGVVLVTMLVLGTYAVMLRVDLPESGSGWTLGATVASPSAAR